MISRAIKYFTCVAIQVLSILFLFQSSVCFTAHGQTENLAHIISALSPLDGKLTGYKITAIETNITFNGNNSALEILQSDIRTNFNKSQIESLEELSHNNTGVVTNIDSYVYRFGNSVFLILHEQHNTLGKLTQKDATFVTDDEVREYRNPVGTIAEPDEKSHVGTAEIRKCGKNAIFGFPVFLSISTLLDFLNQSSVRSCEIGQSSAGQNCNIVTISGTPHTPVDKYKLYFQSDTLTPIEFNSYLANGSIYSRTDLQFEEPGNSPLVCKKTETQMFTDGKLSGQSVWVVQHIEEDKTPLTDNTESFIPPKTQVWDQRFAKPLNYHMGTHPPTPAQINLMLTDSNGVASYESGVHIQAGTNAISSGKRNLIRGVFVALIISPLLIFLVIKFKKR